VTVKKNVYGVSFVLLLTLSAVAGLVLVNFVSANPAPVAPEGAPPVQKITINSDGSITPQTTFISQDGNTYTLTSDIAEYTIHILCSNIVFDGNNHVIRITTPGLHSPIFLFEVANVTLKNIEAISQDDRTINLYYSSYCQLINIRANQKIDLGEGGGNVITRCTAALSLKSGSNMIFKNNIVGSELVVVGSSNTFYLNNILLNAESLVMSTVDPIVNFWDNGTVGNYWSDYASRYSNASEIRQTGIGDTPYVMSQSVEPSLVYPDRPSGTYVLNDNIDHYPLMYPYDIEKDQIALPEREPLPEQETSATVLAAIGISTASIIGAAVGLLYYQKKNKR
jgi:hypothetical protein